MTLEKDLLRRFSAFTRARDKLERRTGLDLIALYEQARAETLDELLNRYGDLDRYELQHIENTMRAIERIMAPVTQASADMRVEAIDAGWEIGQRLALDSLLADASLETPLALVRGRLGVVDRQMVQALFGDMPKLAGKVTADTLERVRNQLVISAVRGESIPNMAWRIAGTGLTQEGLRRPFKTLRARSTLIARTEVIKACDAGYDSLVEQAQQVIQEEIFHLWLVALDERNVTGCECRAIGKGEARWASVPAYPGVYRRNEGPRPVIDTHPGCRCRRVPILLGWVKAGLVKLPNLQAA